MPASTAGSWLAICLLFPSRHGNRAFNLGWIHPERPEVKSISSSIIYLKIIHQDILLGQSAHVTRIQITDIPWPRRLCCLLPLGIHANQTAHRTGKADDAIIEVEPGQRGRGDGQVAKVGNELQAADGTFTGYIVSARFSNGMPNSGGRTYMAILLASTTPSPSFLSTLASRCWRRYRV